MPTFRTGRVLLLAASLSALAYWLAPSALPPARFDLSLPAGPHIDQIDAWLLPAPTRSVHAASVVSTADGDLLAFWFGGTREGAGDVAIWQARFHQGRWQAAQRLQTVAKTASEQWRWVQKLGNPVAIVTGGRIHLFYVSVSLGGWARSQLNHQESADGGVSWSPSQRLTTTPLANISTLVRTAPVRLADGGFWLPVYFELGQKFPQLLRFDREGRQVAHRTMTTQSPLLQPAVVPTGPQTAQAYLRDGRAQAIYQQSTDNGGNDWSPAQALTVANPNASIASARLPDGRLLLAFNPGTQNREALYLAESRDGRHWRTRWVLEQDPGSGHEYSYPVILVHTGGVEVLYTWRRQRIKQVRLPFSALAEINR